jgi:hypothetical protein
MLHRISCAILAALLACAPAFAKPLKGSRTTPTGSAELAWILPADSSTTSQSTSEFGLLTEETRTLVTTIADTTTLTYTVTGLASGTWYFCIAAYSATGEGGCSYIVSKTI